jgi:hypothetical protein
LFCVEHVHLGQYLAANGLESDSCFRVKPVQKIKLATAHAHPA